MKFGAPSERPGTMPRIFRFSENIRRILAKFRQNIHLGRELSLSFEQELDAEADAQEDYRMLRAREAGNLHSVSVMLHRGGSAQRSSAAEFANPLPPLPSPLPIGVGESASTTSGSDPLQSEVLSKVNSNFGAVQDVAQPDAQLADQYFAQPESSP